MSTFDATIDDQGSAKLERTPGDLAFAPVVWDPALRRYRIARAGEIPAEVLDATEGGGAVESVNGQTGAVLLDAADVGAAPLSASVSDEGKGIDAHTGEPRRFASTVALGFHRTSVAANIAAEVDVAIVYPTSQMVDFPVPWPYRVVGLQAAFSTAITVGSATLRLARNGVAISGEEVVMNASARRPSKTWTWDNAPQYTASERVSLRLVTSSDLAPGGSAALNAYVVLALDMDL